MFRVQDRKRERREVEKKIKEWNRQVPHRRMEGERERLMRKQDSLAENITILQGIGK